MNQQEKSETTTRLILISAGRTDWSNQDRIQGNADLPLSDEGIEQVNAWITELSPLKIQSLHSVRSGPAAETARLLAKGLKIKKHCHDDLAEVNVGLWQGMHVSDLKHKHPKVYKRWMEQPERVVPPGGESFHDAQRRLEHSIATLVKNNADRCIAVVLGHLALCLVRLTRARQSVGALWELAKEPSTWYEYLVRYDNFATAPQDHQKKGASVGEEQ